MFPIRDHNPSGRIPYVTYTLIALNILIFFSYYGLMQNPRALSQFYSDWALFPARISSGIGYEGLITSMFLHGGWMHLAGNMLFLWIFGDNIEDDMGHIGYLLFYLASGVAAGLIQVAADPSSMIPTVGASGAIAGIMGSYLLLYPKARVDILIIFFIFFRILPIPAWIVLAIWFGMQFAGGLVSDTAGGGVAYWAHAGGFIAGLALTIPMWLKLGGKRFWQQTEGHPPHPPAQYPILESRIPKVGRK